MDHRFSLAYKMERELERRYLACTTTRDDALIFDSSLHYHDSVVQTSLNFRNELLSPSPQHKRTSLGCRTVFKEIESLSTYLSLLETATST